MASPQRGVANLLFCTFCRLDADAGGLLRMGQIIVFPMPLVTGFTNGIAVLDLLGLS